MCYICNEGGYMKIETRNYGIDIVRIIATITVLCVHFFLNTGYYEYVKDADITVVFHIFIRNFFMICVPLFMLITGYLNKKIEYNKSFFKGLLNILIVWFFYSIIEYVVLNLINGYTEDIAQYPLENSLSLRTTDGISSVNNLPWQIVGTPNLSVFLVNAKNGTITDTQVRSRPIYGDQRLRINSSILNLNCYDYTYTNLYVVDSTDQIMNNRFNYTQFPVRYNGDATSDNADGRCGEASLFGNGRACVGGSPSFDTEQQEEIEYQYGLVDIITGDALTTTEYRQNANFGGGGGGGWGGLFEAVDGSAGGGGAISF